MRFCVTFLALCLSVFCLAQTETAVPAAPEHVEATALVPVKQAIIGYLSYDSALTAMPQRAVVEKRMDELTAQYEAELKRVEEEFNQKYEAFLEGRKDFPRTILLKRQTELQQLMQRNVEFREKSHEELQQAREEAYAPLRRQLSEAIAIVAQRHRLALVVNTDANACPFIEPALAIDLGKEVEQELSKLIIEH